MLKNSLSSQTFEITNPSSSSVTLIAENKNLEENLIKEMKVNIENKNIKEIKGEELKNKVLNWLFNDLNEEERKKICVIQSKMLINILIQLYLLFQKGNNKVEFEPIDDIKIFFNESTFNSFELFSSMDDKKEGKENSEKKFDVNELYYYKNYFNSYLSKKEETTNEEEDFIKFIKIISLNDYEFNTIIISTELISDIEKFKKYFKICTNDNYFEDWLLPFENKNGELNFTMPVWMCRHFEKNLKFSLGQIIFGFFERQILLNYEYFYYTKKIYKLSYFKDITKLYEDNKTLENLILNDLVTFKQFFSKKIIYTIITKNKTIKKYKKINKEIRDIYNKVYFDNFNYPFISRNKLYEDGFDQIIFNEIKSYINGSKDDYLRVKKFVDKLTFLNFSDMINFSQFIYSSYRYFLLKYFLMQEAKKINKINEIHKIYSHSDSGKIGNDNSNSKNSIKTDYNSDQLSICDDDSFSINSDISQKSYKTMTSNENNNINNNPFEIFCNNYYTKGLNDYCKITENNLSILNNIRKQKLNKLINIINENFKDKFDLKIGNYGSYFTDLSIEGSDMDICIIYKAKENVNLNFYNELYNLLKKQKPFLFKIEPLYLEIPLIKLEIDITDEIKIPFCNLYNYINYEDFTRIKIDINVSDNQEYLENCEKNVEYVKSMVKKYPQIRPVLLFLKRYFKKMNMNKVYFGGISSYSLFLLVLNTIKSYSKYNLGISQLLFKVLEKFSSFDFKENGIGTNNYDYKLDFDNTDETLHILDPLTGKNVSKGRCKGGKLNKAFCNAYNLISQQISTFKYFFYSGYCIFNLCPVNSFISVLNSRINFIN